MNLLGKTDGKGILLLLHYIHIVEILKDFIVDVFFNCATDLIHNRFRRHLEKSGKNKE